MSNSDSIPLKKLGLILGTIGALATVSVPVAFRFFRVDEHEKRIDVIELGAAANKDRLQKLETNQEWQNKILWEIRGEVRELSGKGP